LRYNDTKNFKNLKSTVNARYHVF